MQTNRESGRRTGNLVVSGRPQIGFTVTFITTYYYKMSHVGSVQQRRKYDVKAGAPRRFLSPSLSPSLSSSLSPSLSPSLSRFSERRQTAGLLVVMETTG